MKKIFLPLILCVAVSSSAWAGFSLSKIKDAADKALGKGSTQTSQPMTKGNLTNGDVVSGLREALTIGARNSTKMASRVDGFYGNPRIRIPFPPAARKVKAAAEAVGMQSQVTKFVKTLNRAAEEAAKEAAPIFLSAIKGMTIQDGFQILKGSNNAATAYLQRKTSNQLAAKFRPIVQRAINKTQVTKQWSPLASKYNQIPLVKKVNPDLNDYVTQKALQGLFKLIASEEAKIRKNPSARVTGLLQRVFRS